MNRKLFASIVYNIRTKGKKEKEEGGRVYYRLGQCTAMSFDDGMQWVLSYYGNIFRINYRTLKLYKMN